jgi:hypothetical protein
MQHTMNRAAKSFRHVHTILAPADKHLFPHRRAPKGLDAVCTGTAMQGRNLLSLMRTRTPELQIELLLQFPSEYMPEQEYRIVSWPAIFSNILAGD